MSELSALNLSFNPLKAWPDVVTNLLSLVELNLDHTELTDVPPSITRLTRLQGLQLEGVSLPWPLNELCESNPMLLLQVHSRKHMASLNVLALFRLLRCREKDAVRRRTHAVLRLLTDTQPNACHCQPGGRRTDSLPACAGAHVTAQHTHSFFTS